ncbi:MAG: hypothetical protein HONBIEJF_02278 [Fimbriimonadaceae bacterium]|nr:hypothetical protein [Fimbriimonadaceae bacterium]
MKRMKSIFAIGLTRAALPIAASSIGAAVFAACTWGWAPDSCTSKTCSAECGFDEAGPNVYNCTMQTETLCCQCTSFVQYCHEPNIPCSNGVSRNRSEWEPSSCPAWLNPCTF